MIDDVRNCVESPLSFPHCVNEECHFKIPLLTKMLFKLGFYNNLHSASRKLGSHLEINKGGIVTLFTVADNV